jgi:hypothetical protein
MSDFVTVPIVQSSGIAAKGVGRAGTMIETNGIANAGMIVPRSGNISIHMIVSANEPKQDVQLFAAYTTGRGVFKEEWMPPSGQVSVDIEGVDTSQRKKILEGISVEEGAFLGIRVKNLTQGFRLGLCGIFIKYH